MNYKLLQLLVVCSIGMASCQEMRDRSKLYDSVFNKSKPPMERDDVIKILLELSKLYEPDNPVIVENIRDILERAEVSSEKCHKDFNIKDELYVDALAQTGRIGKLLKDAQVSQAKLCMKFWDDTMMTRVASLGESDLDAISLLIENMIHANKGLDFEGSHFDMAWYNAQAGVLQFLDKKNGKSISGGTKRDKFDDLFVKYVSGPCSRLVFKISDASKRYNYLMSQTSLKEQLTPRVIKWPKYHYICRGLLGSKYSSKGNNFHEDLFRHLANRKSHWFS